MEEGQEGESTSFWLLGKDLLGCELQIVGLKPGEGGGTEPPQTNAASRC